VGVAGGVVDGVAGGVVRGGGAVNQYESTSTSR